MGIKFKPDKVKLVVGLISQREVFFEKVANVLAKRFGRVDYKSEIISFDSTSYYNEEMGDGLLRKFLSFEVLQDPSRGPKIKLFSNRLEARLARKGARRINIDPGFITLGKLTLFSTKDYVHRSYLDKGIYAEATLRYQDKSFHPWPWTYPDYQSRQYIEFFNEVRRLYYKQLRNF